MLVLYDECVTEHKQYAHTAATSIRLCRALLPLVQLKRPAVLATLPQVLGHEDMTRAAGQ